MKACAHKLPHALFIAITNEWYWFIKKLFIFTEISIEKMLFNVFTSSWFGTNTCEQAEFMRTNLHIGTMIWWNFYYWLWTQQNNKTKNNINIFIHFIASYFVHRTSSIQCRTVQRKKSKILRMGKDRASYLIANGRHNMLYENDYKQ